MLRLLVRLGCRYGGKGELKEEGHLGEVKGRPGSTHRLFRIAWCVRNGFGAGMRDGCGLYIGGSFCCQVTDELANFTIDMEGKLGV